MILAHDLGTSGDKASLYDGEGRLLASTFAGYATDYGPGGRAEQDPADWWQAVTTATRELLERASLRAKHIGGLSFSGQMQSAVLLDGGGEPVRPAIIWADSRAQAECAALLEGVGLERAYAITGHRLSPTYTLAKCMWVRGNERQAWSRVRAVLLAKDYLAYRLTGLMATDPSDASGTNAYDQVERRWSDELLEAAGIEATLFPEIVPSTTVLGGVTAEAAAATGLVEGTPVVMGGGDGPCANLGAGVIGPADGAYTYLGSSAWISLATDAPLHDPQMRFMTFDHVVPGRFAPTATMQAGGASLEWIGEIVAPGGGPDRLARLVADAGEVQAAFDGLLFLPYLLGERSPLWDPRARGVFVGLARHHRAAHLVRAVLEGVAFNLRSCLLAFEENGRPIPALDAIGGGARSDVWLQILADVWGRPVRRRSLVDEANSLGAAVVGGVATGILPSFEVAGQLSEVGAVFHPEEARHARYGEHYEVFLDAYRRLRTLFHPL
ncbi:MAG: xylulokinase [Chloroflexi bacterium]|nr:xylulokinase [Chloroflexota bacterium]